MQLSSKPRAVVDTNLVVSGLVVPRGLPSLLLQAFRQSRFVLIVSDAVYAEYPTVLARPQFASRGLTQVQWEAFLHLVDSDAMFVAPARSLPTVVRDPKDEHILAAAVARRADYLVSGDRDLLVLADEPSIAPLRVVTVREFLRSLGTLPS
jgi:uncharacterized protein